MLKRLLIIVLTLLPFSRLFAASESDSLRTVEMEQIVVKAARSLRDIGVQKSIMNEAVLKDNLAASMAEVLAQNSSIFIKSSGRATLATASLRLLGMPNQRCAASRVVMFWGSEDLGTERKEGF